MPLVCNAQRTECERPECAEDVYGGVNTNAASAVVVPTDGVLNNMTTCDRQDDWYRVALGAGDGVRMTLNFVDDGFASYDLELRSENVVLNRSETALNREFLQYNVDEAGDYFVRVYGP